MQRQHVTSSNIKSLGWESDTLEVEFQSGAVWRYSNIPQSTYKALMEAKSIGLLFHSDVKSVSVGERVEDSELKA